MYWQREYIREAKSMDLNDTYRLDLPEHGLLGSLLLRLSGDQITGYGQSGGGWRIVDQIDEIEVMLNGATICKSLKGDMVQAVAFYDNRVPSPDAWRNYATNTQWAYFLINFGRFLHDIDYGLELDKFDNVELRVKNSASSSTDFSGLAISVMAIYLRDAPSDQFKGYLRTEEWRKWTTVADETKYLDIPTEFILRRIIMQAIPDLDSDNVAEIGINRLMDDIELNLDSGRTKVYKGGIDDLLRSNYWEYGGPIITVGHAYMSADKGIDMGLGYVMGEAHGAATKDGAIASGIATMESARTDHTQKAEAYAADEPIALMCFGVGYHNTVVYRFDWHPDPASWLDPEARKTVELNIQTYNSADAADGTNRIILDRLVPY